MISVVITVHPPLLCHLPRCLDSVLWQLNAEDECVIVGDGISDDSDWVGMGLKWFCETSARVGSYRTSEAKGECAARNLGLHHAKGDWIKFLDADDLLAPFALNAFRAARPKVEALYEGRTAVLSGQQIKVHHGVAQSVPIDPPDIESAIVKVNPTLASMTFVRRDAAQAVGGFDERIDFEGDWDFWLRLRKEGWRFAVMRTPFCYYWIDDTERAEKEKVRTHQVEGMDVREYFAKTYGITPLR